MAVGGQEGVDVDLISGGEGGVGEDESVSALASASSEIRQLVLRLRMDGSVG
jgi:hypothetical protein